MQTEDWKPHPIFSTVGRRSRLNEVTNLRARAIVYPATLTRAVQAAQPLGYAIAQIHHPSVLQLVAVPWRACATNTPRELVDAIREATGGYFVGKDWEGSEDLHGRLTWNIALGVGVTFDLFVFPARGGD